MSESVVSDRREELLGRLRCEREARARSLPSTLAQRSLVAHAALSGGDGAYHLVGLMLLKGAVDVRRVEEGVARVRARHPVHARADMRFPIAKVMNYVCEMLTLLPPPPPWVWG